MSSSVSPARPSRHVPPRSKHTSTRRSTRSPSPLQPSNVLVMPPSVPKKPEPNGKPAPRRRTPASKRAVVANGSAVMANGHDASTTVQLQDIKEQQDLTVVVEESASAPNGHRDATTAAFPIPTMSVVPKVADEGQESVKKIDWEIPRKALHSSIGLCSPTTFQWLVLTTLSDYRFWNYRPLPWSLYHTTYHICAPSCPGVEQHQRLPAVQEQALCRAVRKGLWRVHA
jgi:hypothetical protein